MDIKGQCLDLRSELADLKAENARLATELESLKSAAPELVVKAGLYHKPDGDGPFCPTCYDNNRKVIRLTENPFRIRRMVGHYSCGVCKSNCSPKYVPPSPPTH